MHAPGKSGAPNAALQAAGFKALKVETSGVEVWLARMDVGKTRVHRLAELLAPDEIQRAARLRSADDRRRFTVAHGMLRHLLGIYLDMAPAAIEFSYGSRGKPRIRRTTPVHFNMAHSGERAVYAISKNRPVGIDIEYLDRGIAFERVARRFFAPAEFDALQKVPATRRRRAFFALWTGKEAVIKATGRGLSQSLARFEIAADMDKHPHIIRAKSKRIAQTILYAPDADAGYMVSVAAMPPVNAGASVATRKSSVDR